MTPNQRELTNRLIMAQKSLQQNLVGVINIAATACLQAECHERGVLLHDDIAPEYRRALRAALIDIYDQLCDRLKAMETRLSGLTESAGISKVKKDLLTVPYHSGLDALTTKFLPAFRKDKAAHRILQLTGPKIADKFDMVAGIMAEILILGILAKAEDLLDCKDETVAGMLHRMSGEAFGKNVEDAKLWMQDRNQKFYAELDKLAVFEDKRFRYLVLEGYEVDEAIGQIGQITQAKVNKLLNGGTDPNAETQNV